MRRFARRSFARLEHGAVEPRKLRSNPRHSPIRNAMQGPHHVSPIKNWKPLVVLILLAFAVPIAVIVLLSQYVTDVSAPAGDDSAVQSRIKPVGEVVVE